jgi:predicted CXXCH cytochrome family protein
MKFTISDAGHLVRLAAIFGAGALLFVAVRAQMVPDDFGRFGHYRAGAIDDARALTPVHAGQATCAGCHADVVELRATSRHAGVSCEACHGALGAHARQEVAKPARPDGRELCIRCHAAKTGKPRQYPTVSVKEHAGEERCITCHTPHNPKMG